MKLRRIDEEIEVRHESESEKRPADHVRFLVLLTRNCGQEGQPR
jgi:hypothetical protein